MPLPRLLLAAVSAALLPLSASAADPVSYFNEVRPIFQQHCLGCHQPAKAQGGFIMTDYAALLKAGETGSPGVLPGDPKKSFLLDEIRVVNGQHEMPKNRPALSAKQIELVERWIREGAKDDTPASAKALAVDADRPPVYRSPPVVTGLSFSPDGSLLAVTGYHEVLLHKADGSGLVARLVGLSERVQAVAFSPDGSRLAVSGGSPGRFGEVQVWDVAKRKLKASTTATADTLFGASWSPDGNLIAVGGTDNTVRAFEAATGKQVLFMGTHSDWVVGTTFAQDGKHLASVSRDMSMKLTEVPTERFVDNVTSITPNALKGGLMTVDRRPVKEPKTTKVPLDDGGNIEQVYDELLSAGSDGTPRLYTMHRTKKRVIGDDANKLKEFAALPGRVSMVKFDADGKRFAAVSSLDGKGEVRVYDVETGKFVMCEGVTGPAYTVAWSHDHKTIASAGFDGTVWLHDPTTGKKIKEFVAVPLSPKTARK